MAVHPAMAEILSAFQSAPAQARNITLHALLSEIHAHLDSALSQSLPEDDQIIVGHLREARTLTRIALRECK